MCPLTFRGAVVGVMALQRAPTEPVHESPEYQPRLHWERRRHDQLTKKQQQLKKRRGRKAAYSRQLYSSSSSSSSSESGEGEGEEDTQEDDRHRMDKRSRRLLTYMCTRLHLQLAQASNLAAVLHVATHTIGLYFSDTGRKSAKGRAGRGVTASRKVLLADAATKADAQNQEHLAQLQTQAAIIAKREASLLKYRDQVTQLVADNEELSQKAKIEQNALHAAVASAEETAHEAVETLARSQAQARQQAQAAQERAAAAEQELRALRKKLFATETESAARYQMLQTTRPVLAHAKEVEADYSEQQKSISELESAMKAAQELLSGED